MCTSKLVKPILRHLCWNFEKAPYQLRQSEMETLGLRVYNKAVNSRILFFNASNDQTEAELLENLARVQKISH